MLNPLVVHTHEDDKTVLFYDRDKATKYIVKYAKQTNIYDGVLQELCRKAVCINDAIDILEKFHIQGIRVNDINEVDPRV